MKIPALGFVLSLAYASAASANTISTMDYWDSTVSPFGTPDTATYGQTITIGDTAQVLESFSFILSDLRVAFTVEVGSWTGSRVDEVIYRSDPFKFAATSDYMEIMAFPDVTLNADSQYVLYFTTSGIQSDVESMNEWGFTPDEAYAGGTFVYLNNGNDRSQLTSVDWNTDLGGDLAFTATLAPVPEPSMYGLLLAGLGLLGFAARRKMLG
ncbi:FxDxF family PEP-CTERM protein [Methylobacillus sp.]|uniref:FxDxF family PEP-CTERM protein n=1 Tax=Methylobacillus sp. TaxID=56818 RepID=UPI002FDFE9A2